MAVRKLLMGVACLTLMNMSSTAIAQPSLDLQVPLALNAQTAVEQAQYRGRGGFRDNRGYRRGGGGGGDGGVALGIGAAIIGGILLSEAARAEHRTNNGGDWERCAETYRSFERNTGMYTGYDGERRTCPYLR